MATYIPPVSSSGSSTTPAGVVIRAGTIITPGPSAVLSSVQVSGGTVA